MARAQIFSHLPHALVFTVYSEVGINEETNRRKRVKRGKMVIPPGVSWHDANLWREASKSRGIADRVKNGYLKEEHTPTRRDLLALNEPASKSLITELCAKTSSIPDDQLMDSARASGALGGTASGSQAQLERELKAIIEKLDRMKG